MEYLEVPYPDIYLDYDKKVVKKGKNAKGEETKYVVSDPIWIEQVNQNIDTGEVTANIGYYFLNREKHVLAKREEYLNKQEVLKFQKYGMDVLHSNASDVVKHLRNQEEQAKRVITYSNLGFGNIGKKNIYKLDTIIGIKQKTQYEGEYDIFPKGNEKEWWEMYHKEVKGKAELELICIVGVSSILIGYIGEAIGLDNLLIHLTGNSTTGKSTAMKLAISLFGYPDVKRNGLFTSFNGTGNALIKGIAGLVGVPKAIDELSMSNKKELDTLVYRLANGVDKKRLNKNAVLKPSEIWLTTILTNGEESIIQGSSNAGLFTRVFEFENVKWTKDAFNAQAINRTVLSHYGHVGKKFAEKVLQMDKEALYERFEKNVEVILNLFKAEGVEDPFINRRANRHAVILTAMDLFEEIFKVQVQQDDIKNLLVNLERESIKKRNLGTKAVDYLINATNMNLSKFDVYYKARSCEPIISKASEQWGKVILAAGYTEIEFNPIVFEKLINQAAFKSTVVVLKELKEQGVLNHEKDKLYRKRKNHRLGQFEKVYVLRLRKDDEDSTFDGLNYLIDKVSNFQMKKLLLQEKERRKQESTIKK